MSDLLPGRLLRDPQIGQYRLVAVHALLPTERSERSGPDAAIPQRARRQEASILWKAGLIAVRRLLWSGREQQHVHGHPGA